MNNLLTNGGMAIDQAHEGAAVSIDNLTLHSADGWNGSNENTGCTNVAIQRVEDAPPGARHSLKLTVGTATTGLIASSKMRIHANIGYEDVECLKYGTVDALATSVSFSLKANVAGRYAFAIANTDGSRCFFKMLDITSADTWQYFTVNIPGCTDGTWTTSYDIPWGYMVFSVVCGTDIQSPSCGEGQWVPHHGGSDNTISQTGAFTNGFTFQVAEVMWVAGGTAIPYQQDIHDILRCKRRYEKSYNPGIIPGTINNNGCGYMFGNCSGVGKDTRFSVVKAKTPVVTYYSPITGASGYGRDFNGNRDVIPADLSSLTGQTGFLTAFTNLTTPQVAMFHWVADCRL